MTYLSEKILAMTEDFPRGDSRRAKVRELYREVLQLENLITTPGGKQGHMKLSNDQHDSYLKNPLFCPFCNGTITGENVEIDHPYAYQPITCDECGARWVDTYRMESVLGHEEGGSKVKAIIKGKRYDTSKSELIGEAWGGTGPGDFNYWTAGLYRTSETGAYFVAGSGAALTQFAQTAPGGSNARVGGSKIIPLGRHSALNWAEENLDTEIVEWAFGDVIQDA